MYFVSLSKKGNKFWINKISINSIDCFNFRTIKIILGQQKTKTKRIRTTFADEQLAVLQTHFQIDSNPDGADLERIATMTGLSKRVTQVWFQVNHL